MHIEFLTEDASGGIFLRIYLERFLPITDALTWNIHSYRGIGRIPKGLSGANDPGKRLILDQIPRLLRGFSKTPYVDAVIIIVDSDNRNACDFKNELLSTIPNSAMNDKTYFYLAIEELEAWFLGDKSAILIAYPNAKKDIMNNYSQDSVCGTWERLADAIYPGGYEKVRQVGWPLSGKLKCEWAERITPNMNPSTNTSQSFQLFRDGIFNIRDRLNLRQSTI